MENDSEIAKWYGGKTIFITGATGFMGKVLVEKLLRCCPDVGPIYVMIREKKNVHPRDRVEKLMTCEIFDEIRATKSQRKNWILPISGDIGLPDLGISDKDRRLLQDKVSVVFHLAATVRFDENLRIAMAINVSGTRTLLEMCRGMKNLCAFVHVSTAYSNCVIPIIEERIYQPPADPIDIQNFIDTQKDENLDSMTSSLIGEHPNTYTFTKALAEHIIAEYATVLPIVVVRPSIVSSSWREPKPGWIDNFNGPAGLIVAGGKGILKIIYIQEDVVSDIIPVDVCINLFLAAAWDLHSREDCKFSRNVLVYNCVSRPFRPITWKRLVRVSNDCGTEYIMSDVFMCPSCEVTHCKVKHDLIKASCQTIPAILADLLIKIAGGKPKFQHYQSQLNKAMVKLGYFMTHEWNFKATNVEQLKQRLSPADQKIFQFDMTKMDWTEYLSNSYLGLRRYLLKETDDTLPAAKRSLARWILLKRAAQYALLVPVSYAIMFFSGVSFGDALKCVY